MDDGRIRLPSKVRKLLIQHKVNKLRPTILPNEKGIALCPEQYWSKWLEKLFDEDTLLALTLHSLTRQCHSLLQEQSAESSTTQ